MEDLMEPESKVLEENLVPTEEMVELVGGPLCGVIRPRAQLPYLSYFYGMAEYQYEGFGKARYIKDV